MIHHGERLNGWTHLIGTALAIAGLPLLVLSASRTGRALPVVTACVYGSTLVLLYLVSTLYHSLRGRAKEIFQVLDHVAIFLLIAGTYTPVALTTIGGPLGWTLFGVNWGLAAVGIGCELAPWRHGRAVALGLYVVMGWLAIGALSAVFRSLGPIGGTLIVAGGLAYTIGIVFYAWRSLPHSHGIWHLFVLAGSACHFVAIVLFGY